jgi:TldD protein
MNSEDWLIDRLMKEGASYAEVRLQRNLEFGVILRNGMPEAPEYDEAYGVAIRVICDGALAFASTNMTGKEQLVEAGMRAIRSAKAIAGAGKQVSFSSEAPHRQDWAAECKEDPTKIDAAAVLDLLRSVDAEIVGTKGVKFPNRLLVFGGSMEEKHYANSDGTTITSRVPRVEGQFIITAFDAEKGTLQRIVQVGESGGWERAGAMDPALEMKGEAEGMAKVLLEGRQAPSERYDVVVGSEVSGIMAHEACGHPQEADRILGREAAQAGESYVKADMIGRRIGSSLVNISDCPSIPHSYGFYLYDDEGVEAKKKELMKAGVITGFLHNRETAHDFGVASNAAMRATSYAREPIIRMSNTYVEAGDSSLDEMLEDCRAGIYVKSFQEWNIDDLRWNNRYVGLEAYMIRDGELGAPIRSPIIEATTDVIFSSVEAVGREVGFKAATCGKGQPSQGAPVWTGGPPMKMRGLLIKSR